MLKFFRTRYRVNRDWFMGTTYWMVQKRIWWWPFWIEERGLLPKEQAIELKDYLNEY